MQYLRRLLEARLASFLLVQLHQQRLQRHAAPPRLRGLYIYQPPSVCRAEDVVLSDTATRLSQSTTVQQTSNDTNNTHRHVHQPGLEVGRAQPRPVELHAAEVPAPSYGVDIG